MSNTSLKPKYIRSVYTREEKDKFTIKYSCYEIMKTGIIWIKTFKWFYLDYMTL